MILSRRSETGNRSRWLLHSGIGLALVLFVGACSSSDDTTATETSTTTSRAASTGEEPSAESTPTSGAAVEQAPGPTGPAPGVTDDAITIGVNYVDTESLIAVGLDFDLGDHGAVYQALIDDINDAGGIHGRMLDPVFAAINPTNGESADAVCLQLTEDEDVFLITGFFLLDAVLCPLDLHETAVVGGNMTPERIAQANAPWLAWLPDDEQPKAIIEAFAAGGEFDGRVAVYAASSDEGVVDSLVLPTLADLGIDPVAIGIMDAPTDDTAELLSSVQLVAERFEAEAADTILLVGASAATWPQYMIDNTSYRPNLRFLASSAPNAFATSGANSDTSILDGALTGGSYGPDQARYDEPAMQECRATLAAAGVVTASPSDFDADDASNQPYQAAFQACPDIALMRAWLEAAGPDLNYGTLDAAVDGLELVVPGDPALRAYGPAPAADGDPLAYLFRWDSATQGLVPVEG